MTKAKSVYGLLIEDYFTTDSMSVHIKEGLVPTRKCGKPGAWKLEDAGKEPLDSHEIAEIIGEFLDECDGHGDGMIEMEKKGCTVIQLGPYRIVITKFPFSESTEITAVRPIKSLCLEDYKMSAKLKNRLESRAEGILVAGPPGAGKSTFACALAEFYNALGKTVKTMEHPRDLQVSREITQYSALDGSMVNTGDILLLVRPDYTVYDEVRKPDDFLIFEDLRLAGVGMIGVCHGSLAIDAIQRFVGKVELGVIPQVIDTLIFIKGGQVSKTLTLKMTVKTPTGMTEKDLARPVVEVTDFESGDLEYEIYTYGEQVVVIPVKEVAAKAAREYAQISEGLEDRIMGFVPEADIKANGTNVDVCVPEKFIKRLIGRGGSTINGIEREFGVSINVNPMQEKTGGGRKSVPIDSGSKAVVINAGKHNAGRYMRVLANGEEILMAPVSRRGEIQVKKKSKKGRQLMMAMDAGKDIKFEAVV